MRIYTVELLSKLNFKLWRGASIMSILILWVFRLGSNAKIEFGLICTRLQNRRLAIFPWSDWMMTILIAILILQDHRTHCACWSQFETVRNPIDAFRIQQQSLHSGPWFHHLALRKSVGAECWCSGDNLSLSESIDWEVMGLLFHSHKHISLFYWSMFWQSILLNSSIFSTCPW